MDNERQLQWRHILATSEQLLALAQAGEWDQLLERYHQRDELLHAFFAETVAEDEADFLRQAIPELLAQDEALRTLCATARNEAARELGKVNLGRKAEAAYNRFGG